MEDLSNLRKRIRRIENIFWVAAIVAAIFGVSGAYGAKLLSDASSEITSLNERITHMVDTVRQQEEKSVRAVRDAEQASITAINDATEQSLKLLRIELAKLKIKVSKVRTQSCPNVKSGKINTCKCADGEVMLGVRHHDTPADGKEGERVVGIVCGKVETVPEMIALKGAQR